MTATQAAFGRVECPECLTFVESEGLKKTDALRCPQCGWEVLYGDYYATIQRQNLFWGGEFPAVRDFLDGFDVAKTPRDKMLLVDKIIHACHWEMTRYPGRPAAMLVIEGREREVVALIETLAYADNRPGEGRCRWEARKRGERVTDDPRPWREAAHGLVEEFQRQGRDLADRLRETAASNEG